MFDPASHVSMVGDLQGPRSESERIAAVTTSAPLTHLSLFSGIGGIDLAAEQVGFRTIAFVEKNAFCQKVLAKHWPGVPIYDDIRTVDIHRLGLTGTTPGEVTLVSGGFPCQPHSLCGLRKASGDERDLWSEMFRVIGEVRPRWVLAENVPGLLTSESGQFFGRVVTDLASLGMRVGWGTYGAGHVGARHRRLRVFVVAHMASRRPSAVVPAPWRFDASIQPGRVRPSFRRPDGTWEPDEHSLAGELHGIPNGLDTHRRAHALGNCVVPDQVLPILAEIRTAEVATDAFSSPAGQESSVLTDQQEGAERK